MSEESKPIVCEHGAEQGWWMQHVAAYGWNGPVSVCTCCGSMFGYINSVDLTSEGSSGQSWTTDLCVKCGGHFVEW